MDKKLKETGFTTDTVRQLIAIVEDNIADRKAELDHYVGENKKQLKQNLSRVTKLSNNLLQAFKKLEKMENPVKAYTVLSLYQVDGFIHSDIFLASTGEEALHNCAIQRLGKFENDAYEHEDEVEMIVAIEGKHIEGETVTFAGDSTVEARDYIDHDWRFEMPKEGGKNV